MERLPFETELFGDVFHVIEHLTDLDRTENRLQDTDEASISYAKPKRQFVDVLLTDVLYPTGDCREAL